MIRLIFLGEHVVACSLCGDDEVCPVCDGLRNLVEIHMIEAVLVALECAVFLQEVVAHHVGTSVSVSSAETY